MFYRYGRGSPARPNVAPGASFAPRISSPPPMTVLPERCPSRTRIAPEPQAIRMSSDEKRSGRPVAGRDLGAEKLHALLATADHDPGKGAGRGREPVDLVADGLRGLSPVDLRLALLDFAGVAGAGGGLWLELQLAGFERA